jgi:hypothetical protein
MGVLEIKPPASLREEDVAFYPGLKMKRVRGIGHS